jgi:triacylglycerol lipase
MATLSQLAYIAHNQGTEVVSQILKLGCPPFVQQYQTIEFLHAPRLFSSTGELVCCGFVLSTPNQVVIVIRGTENLEDYFFNLLVQPNSEFIHSGFHNYVEKFWAQLPDFLLREDNGRKDIFVTGHSLGGAAATLIAKRLQEPGFKPVEPHVLETYTFGAPPVSTVDLMLDTPLYRFRNAGDFIPHLPKIVSVLINRIPRL